MRLEGEPSPRLTDRLTRDTSINNREDNLLMLLCSPPPSAPNYRWIQETTRRFGLLSPQHTQQPRMRLKVLSGRRGPAAPPASVMGPCLEPPGPGSRRGSGKGPGAGECCIWLPDLFSIMFLGMWSDGKGRSLSQH